MRARENISTLGDCESKCCSKEIKKTIDNEVIESQKS